MVTLCHTVSISTQFGGSPGLSSEKLSEGIFTKSTSRSRSSKSELVKSGDPVARAEGLEGFALLVMFWGRAVTADWSSASGHKTFNSFSNSDSTLYCSLPRGNLSKTPGGTFGLSFSQRRTRKSGIVAGSRGRLFGGAWLDWSHQL